MKKALISLMMLFVIILSACGSNNSGNNAGAANATASNNAGAANASPSADTTSEATGTITFQSESGPMEVPANPKRIVDLSSYTGSLISLGLTPVGVTSWAKDNPNFTEQLKDVTEVSEEDVEKILELEPDLIIGTETTKNVDKLKEIAPTVIFTYNKVDYLQQHIEVGKAVNKEKEATAWVEDFKARATQIGKDIKAKIGEDSTVTVIENYDKELYMFGDAWGRGTEILYQAMGLKMPEKVKEMTSKDGWYALSLEVLPQYAGDYIVFSQTKDTAGSITETETYKNIPAVKNNHVITADARGFYFNDAYTLDYQLNFFKEQFLGK
ncbi:iron-hydroxamate ABC transporter substrate-binding protein [Paenibacillus sp. BK720]|uniref:iron-hydroxamate ABC transporter substrate-binding protein n=1 Tax=Paenibacillus sp. BK720 TaxID=2587092 RepID=UPI001423DBA2|nr:iron-hydroxamate ABC transporter substrate-binding protein [Paenibacillus sp. BK720]NIK71240.1 iron complex transport system substrate-binding protein [Paenibacillus sp. BK720]